MKSIRELKAGDFFKLSPSGKTVYVRGYYERETARYVCWKADDVNDFREFRGDKMVFTEFVY